jgi:hypothetical protein
MPGKPPGRATLAAHWRPTAGGKRREGGEPWRCILPRETRCHARTPVVGAARARPWEKRTLAVRGRRAEQVAAGLRIRLRSRSLRGLRRFLRACRARLAAEQCFRRGGSGSEQPAWFVDSHSQISVTKKDGAVAIRTEGCRMHSHGPRLPSPVRRCRSGATPGVARPPQSGTMAPVSPGRARTKSPPPGGMGLAEPAMTACTPHDQMGWTEPPRQRGERGSHVRITRKGEGERGRGN